jgi:pSer/pThr/pTyr-binding forkhead associated (FHA) protein
MTDQVLDILKLVLLALLYLFFARVLWAVWSEVRQPEARAAADRAASDGTPAAGANWRANAAPAKPARGKRGTPARLVVIEPKERSGTVYPIGTEPIRIGREETNTIVIGHDPYVSGLHATVSAVAGGVVIDDVASKNGTYVNGARLLRQRELAIGDRIQIGATVLEAQ